MLPRNVVIPAGRVVLREPTKADADAIARACADTEMIHFLPALPTPYTTDDARMFVGEIAPALWAGGGACFAVADPAADAWLGTISLKPVDDRANGEIGYMVAPWARGRGVASMAARALTEWTLVRGVHRVQVLTSVDNIASQRVAMAAGFRREGVQRGAAMLRDGGRDDLIAFARLTTDSGEPQRSYLPGLPGGSLSDGVVRLAPLAPGDADPYHEMMSDPEVFVYTVPPKPPGRKDSEQRCRYTATWWLSGERAELAVRDAATDEFAGHIQLVNVTPPLAQAMIGYSLSPRFRGRGFMTRAVNLLAGWAFENTGLHRLVAGTALGNTASHRVLERAGFTREALVKALLPRPGGTWDDDVQWVRFSEPAR